MPDDPLVTPEWLHEHLGDERVKVVDCSWYLPGDPRDPKAEFEQARIPGAVFFDIDEIADRASPMAHMAPPPEQFALQVGALGIAAEDTVVVYDGVGLFSAPRGWWTFRLFGHAKVFVLEGGLPRWKAEHRPLEHGPREAPAPVHYTAATHAHLVRSLDEVRRALDEGSEQVLDVRPADRFRGDTPEPRPGMRAGHMPAAKSLPVSELLADGGLKPAAELDAAFRGAGIDVEGPIVTTCGSGVAACTAALALARLGRWQPAVYDGSWTEWGSRADTPVVTGPA